jgi:hypothetical protein
LISRLNYEDLEVRKSLRLVNEVKLLSALFEMRRFKNERVAQNIGKMRPKRNFARRVPKRYGIPFPALEAEFDF